MIQLEKVSRKYRSGTVETTALDAVSLTIGKGEFVAVMGPSGCGKSTLMNVVGMIDTPDGGDYFFDGENVSRYGEGRLVEIRKKNIGFIFQSFNLINELSVYENVELPLLYQDMARSQRKKRVREVLELVNLRAREKHRPAQLSGGQQQRVAVARAVVGDPKLILADEPTGNLDSQNGAEVMEMLETLNSQGATILMVTHSAQYAQNAGRVITIRDGRIVASEPGASVDAKEAPCSATT